MIKPQMISNSPHCVEGHRHACRRHECHRHTHHKHAAYSIQPIDVIERWALCPHLGAVIKHLARTGHQDPALEQTCLKQTRLKQTSLRQMRLEAERLQQIRLGHLKKAAWYLLLEINNEQARTPQTRVLRTRVLQTQVLQTHISQARISQQRGHNLPDTCTNDPHVNDTFFRDFPFTPEAISKDWGLSPRLEEVIFYIATFQKLFYRFPLTRTVCLKQALKHLRAEIKAYEYLKPPRGSIFDGVRSSTGSRPSTGVDLREGGDLRPIDELEGSGERK